MLYTTTWWQGIVHTRSDIVPASPRSAKDPLARVATRAATAEQAGGQGQAGAGGGRSHFSRAKVSAMPAPMLSREAPRPRKMGARPARAVGLAMGSMGGGAGEGKVEGGIRLTKFCSWWMK
jgi:hypothetical protein